MRSSAPLILVILIGALLRWDFATPYNYVIDSDEAIVGLMAKHIYEGKTIPTFYYGQHYMGSLEAILAAASFAIFGLSNFALKLVPLLFSVAFIPLMYLLVRQCATRPVALLTALLIAIPPAPLVVWSSKARGGFIEVICIGTLGLLTSFIWLNRARPALLLTAITGLLLGLGWWVNNQIIFFIAPIGLIFIYGLLRQSETNKIRSLASHGIIGLIAFFIGGLPFWLYNIEHNFITFEMFKGAADKDLSKHLSGLFSTALPIILGGKRFWQEEEYLPAGSQISLILYAGLFLSAFVFSAKNIWAALTLKPTNQTFNFFFLMIFVISTLAIFSLSSFGYLVQAPRYLLPLYVGIIPVVSFALFRLGKAIGGSILCMLLMINLASSYWGEKTIPGEPYVYDGERVSQDHSELLAWLKANNYTFVKTNYWIGYRLAFESNEAVRFLMFEDPYQIRIPEYQKAGHNIALDRVPLVLVPAQAKIVRKALRALHLPFHDQLLSGYVVITTTAPQSLTGLANLKRLSISPDEVSASPKGENAALALDHNAHSRWGSGEHQHPGMKFIVSPKVPVLLKGIRLDMGDWPHDFPRLLEIVATKEDGSNQVILSKEDYQAIRYLQDHELIEFRVSPTLVRSVELRQVGYHPVFDWSIAEFSLLVD